MSKKKKRIDIVYSTNPDFDFNEDMEETETLPNEDQELVVSIDRKQRKGKSVTLVDGFVGAEEGLKELSKTLKSKCGVGGASKNQQILIQGDFKEKVHQLLIDLGYTRTKKR